MGLTKLLADGDEDISRGAIDGMMKLAEYGE